jgi:cytochrome c oxidase subunit 2
VFYQLLMNLKSRPVKIALSVSPVRMRRRPGPVPRGVLVGLAVVALLLAGCSGQQSALNPGGPSAGRIAALWWWLLGIATVVWLIVVFLVVWALVLRRGPDVKPRRGGERTVVVAGIVLPTLILLGVFAGAIGVLKAQAQPPKPSVLTIEVVGHDWWWEVRYPDFVTANEIHVPVGQSVHVKLRTADVIHSFWVPSLTSKTDLIPNKDNDTWLQADKAGTYRGQCAEYCGVQHAGMSFLVVAQPRADFDRWMADEARPAQTPTQALATRGEQVFESQSCSACHTIRGTTADGKVGPDLTHFGSRQQLGAGVAPNDPGWLGGWISNSQSIKPGNNMPPQPLAPEDLQALIAYLEGQK